MKRILWIGAFVTFGCLLSVNVDAQDKPSKKDLRNKHVYERVLDKKSQKKALKGARKETKMLRKEGFQALPGQLSMNRQLENSWQKQMETNANGDPCWYIASSRAIGNSQPAAALQAVRAVKTDLAGQIQRNISQFIESQTADQAIGREETAKLVEIVGANREIISDALGRTIPLVEVYRILPDQDIEAMVCLGYSVDAANKVAVSAIRDELAEKSDPLAGELDKLGY